MMPHKKRHAHDLGDVFKSQRMPRASRKQTSSDLGLSAAALQACTWTNLSSSNKIPRNYKILKKMHACAFGANHGKKMQKTKNLNYYF